MSVPATVVAVLLDGSARQLALVTGIVDGDTIHAAIGNRTETLRYIGDQHARSATDERHGEVTP